jgi:hypothetical protein
MADVRQPSSTTVSPSVPISGAPTNTIPAFSTALNDAGPHDTGSVSDSSVSNPQANTATWRTRNPGRPVVPTRPQGRKRTAAEKASRELSRKNSAKRELLENALKVFQEENKMKLEALTHAHGVTDKYLKDLLGYQVNYHSTRKPMLWNALLHAKAKEVNQSKHFSPLLLTYIRS